MDWGMKNRLSQIIKPKTGRSVMLAVDHGYFQGPTTGLETPAKDIAPLVPYADALMVTRGLLRNCMPADSGVAVVLRVSGGSSILKELSNEEITVEFEDAVRLNSAAVALSIFVGAEFERQTLVSLAKLCDLGQRFGVPVLAVTAVGREMVRDARYLGLASRIAAELGAHIVKTYYCDDFEQVVRNCPVPVVIAGGKKLAERDALELAYNAVQHGAVGVDMGRNIFQSDSPLALIRCVRAVVHDNATPKEAYEMFQQLRPTAAAATS